MRIIRKVYLLVFTLSTIGAYALVFGEVGYIKRKMAKKELVHLQRKVSILKAENHHLSEQYSLLSSKKKSLQQAHKKAKNLNLTILKFEEEKAPKADFFDFFSDPKDSIVEARIFFLVIMLFLGSCGYLLLYRLERKGKATNSE